MSERLGYTSIRITMDLYSHAVLGLQRHAAARLTQRLQPYGPLLPRARRLLRRQTKITLRQTPERQARVQPAVH